MTLNINNILVEVIKTLTPNVGRKPSKEITHYLDKIKFVLDSDINWKYLEGPLHHDTYRKKHQFWSELGVYEEAHNIICKLLQNKFYNHTLLKKLYMDSSDILNKKGVESIGRSKKYKFKKATKINIITDQFGIILAIKIVPANDHDTQLTEETLDKIRVKILHSRKYPKYLTVDKGYIDKKTKNAIKKKVSFMYPDKINTVNCPYNYRQNQERIKLLESRFINENAFSWLKNTKRTTLRYDRKISTFSGFVYLQALKVNLKKINLLNINLL